MKSLFVELIYHQNDKETLFFASDIISFVYVTMYYRPLKMYLVMIIGYDYLEDRYYTIS